MMRSIQTDDQSPPSESSAEKKWWEGAPEWYPRRWIQYVDWIETNDIPFVRYEDLVRDPSGELGSIFRVLGLSPYAPPSTLSHRYSGVGDDDAMEDSRVHKRSLKSFRDHLPASTLDAFETVCGHRMQDFGYDT